MESPKICQEDQVPILCYVCAFLSEEVKGMCVCVCVGGAHAHMCVLLYKTQLHFCYETSLSS